MIRSAFYLNEEATSQSVSQWSELRNQSQLFSQSIRPKIDQNKPARNTIRQAHKSSGHCLTHRDDDDDCQAVHDIQHKYSEINDTFYAFLNLLLKNKSRK